MKIRDEDPLLAKLMGEDGDQDDDQDDDRDILPKNEQTPDPVIGQDPNTFVFRFFPDVLRFLEKHFQDVDKM